MQKLIEEIAVLGRIISINIYREHTKLTKISKAL